jgi:hypothetical protein
MRGLQMITAQNPLPGITGPILQAPPDSLEQTGRLKVGSDVPSFSLARPAARLKSVSDLGTDHAYKSVPLGPRPLARVLQRNASFRSRILAFLGLKPL